MELPDFYKQAEEIKYSGEPLSTLTDRIAKALKEAYINGYNLSQCQYIRQALNNQGGHNVQ